MTALLKQRKNFYLKWEIISSFEQIQAANEETILV